jgi:hypothetical protein
MPPNPPQAAGGPDDTAAVEQYSDWLAEYESKGSEDAFRLPLQQASPRDIGMAVAVLLGSGGLAALVKRSSCESRKQGARPVHSWTPNPKNP